MAGGFDEKAGGAQMGVMQGPMVRDHCWHLLPAFVFIHTAAYECVLMC